MKDIYIYIYVFPFLYNNIIQICSCCDYNKKVTRKIFNLTYKK